MVDINIVAAKEKLQRKGFLDIDVSPDLDLFSEIEKLKKEKVKNPFRNSSSIINCKITLINNTNAPAFAILRTIKKK